MAMWLYDDVREMEDFQNYQREVRQLEGEYLEIRVVLRDAERELRIDPESEYLQAKVKYLRKRLRHLESQAPRLAADHPLEISLWATVASADHSLGAKRPQRRYGVLAGMERLDRQLRIGGWNQSALDKSRIGVVGDDDLLASLFLLSAAALGINQLVVVAPALNGRLVDVARKVNPLLDWAHLEGFYTHPVQDDFFRECSLAVDLSHYGLATKLLIEKGFREAMPVVRGFCYERGGAQGLRVFTYLRGREWRELDQVVTSNNLPREHFDDGVLDTIVAGIVLEEVKNLLMEQRISGALIGYERGRLGGSDRQPRILVVGAGALGNFVGLGLAFSGYEHCTFLDPDVVEVTNLNRQIFLYDALGQSKAETLSARMNGLFQMKSQALVEYLQADMDLSSYDVVFDCVDNFETRIVLSGLCRDQGRTLISGGTSADAGQVVVYDPARHDVTPGAGCSVGAPGSGRLHVPPRSLRDHDQPDHRRFHGGFVQDAAGGAGDEQRLLRLVQRQEDLGGFGPEDGYRYEEAGFDEPATGRLVEGDSGGEEPCLKRN